MGFQALFVVLLLFVATVESDGSVSFWREKVTLTCPENGTWTDLASRASRTSETDDGKYSKTLEFQFRGQAHFRCAYKPEDAEEISYMFFVKGKACKNCFEVDGFLFMLVILVDVIGTAVVMRIIYVYTKKKHPYVPPQPARSRGPRPRPDQSSAYEPLNRNTQATETYSTVVTSKGRQTFSN